MRGTLTALLVLAVGATAAFAQNVSIIKERKSHFEALGKAAKPVNAMFKGEASFDIKPVQAALKTFQEKAAVSAETLPDDSKTGGDTEALAKIWEDKADFEGRFKKLADRAKAAEAEIKDEATFKDAWKDVMGNCSGCHKIYRKPKS